LVKVIRKKGLEKVKLVHNKKLFWTIIILGIILIAVIVYLVIYGKWDNNNNNVPVEKECLTNNDCVPVCGCHPSSCTPANIRPQCEKLFCTQDCSGPLDCSAGHCECINGKCGIVSDIK